MSQCVPSWDLDDGPSHRLQAHHPSSTTTTRLQMSDYGVAELTWENGHLAMHGHRGGAPRVGKPPPKDPSAGVTWEKPHPSGTLEAVVDQATRAANPAGAGASNQCHLVPCLGAKNPHHHLAHTCVPVPAAVDALVPSPNLPAHGGDEHQQARIVPDSAAGPAADGGGTCIASCSGRKRARLGAADGGNCSVTGSATSMGLTFDTYEINGGDDAGFATSASPVDGSPETENTSCGRPLNQADDYDSVCHSRRNQRDGCYEEKGKGEMGRSSVSTKRSRAAAIHNQSERKRRDRINQKMKTLQKLVPNSSKTDKASILDEVIEYLKQLQAQVQVMSRMSSVPHMMMPVTTMQHMQMAIMAQMAQMAQMGVGMGMGMMDMNALGRGAEQSGMAPILPQAAFLPPSGSWDVPGGGDRLQLPAGAVLPDPFAAFMACQNQQPTTMDAYGRMASLYRQLYQQPQGPNSKT